MQQVQTRNHTAETIHAQDGTAIPKLQHDEAMVMSREELNRFLDLITSLDASDWDKQTACPLWTVKDVVAHQAGHVRGFVSVGSFLAQLSPTLLFPYLRKGMDMLDAWNQGQVDKRKSMTPADLIDEIQTHAEASLKGKDSVPAFLSKPKMPAPGLDQPRSMAYVFDVTYVRDMWMHRIDICQATGRDFPLDDGHDQRTVDLIVRDLALKCTKGLSGRSVILNLTDLANGHYRVGQSASPEATLTMDTITFCLLTSGRMTPTQLLNDNRVTLSGDEQVAREALAFFENRVLY